MEKKRSIGVTIIGIFDILVSIASLVTIIYWIIRYPDTALTVLVYFGFIVILFGLAGIGLLRLKHWARYIHFFILAPIIIPAILFWFSWAVHGLILLIPVELFIIYYFFTRPKVKEQFK